METKRKRTAKAAVTRTVHVECATARGYRWLVGNQRGAILNADGTFTVISESDWSQSLAAAEGKEIA